MEGPAHSPDLVLFVIVLFIYFLKPLVYGNRVIALQDLRANIRAEVANIAAAMEVRVMTNARYRLTHRMENMGHGFDFQN